MTELEASGVGDHPPPYMIFLVVFLFFITGLLGFLICHLLKKKGYRCRTGDMDDDEQEEEKLGENTDDEDEENQDTVEQILKCIIENEANMEAFNEMLGSRNICVRHDPRLRKESIGGVPPHHHTVHSGADHTSCHLCAQIRSKKGRRQSRTPRSKHRPGEQTVFSVGRFRVTHTDKKPQGSPNPMVSSDQLDQSQDSEDQKEGGYNLRSMFKDVRPPTENVNGVAPPVGKRRKSMTIFGLRRGSDPVGIRAVEGAMRETVKFSVQQPPVVPEEQVQTETSKTTPERGTRPGSRSETDPSKSQRPTSPRHEPKTAGYEKETHASSPGPDGSPKHQPNLQFKPSAPAAPSSLQHVGDKVSMEAFDPEPQQTSTPIFPMPGSLPGFSPVVPTASCSTADVPVIQTPPNPSSSSDLEPSFGASLALISLGSSSSSSFQMKSPSPASSLKTSPIPSEAASSRGLTPSPKLPSGRAVSIQSTVPSKTASPLQTHSPVLSPSPKLDTRSQLTLESGSVMSGMSMTTTADVKRKGILKTPALSPSEGSKGSALSSPSDQLSKDRLSSLPVSPSSPLSPSSPGGSRVSSVTIVKASPDSKREFSVSTMAEDERKDRVSPAAGEGSDSGTGPPETQRAETAAAERPTLSQDREDMVEMEDIRDCKVTEGEEGERRTEEEEEKEIIRTSD